MKLGGEKGRSETRTESFSYAVGNLKDIKVYFELKHPNKIVEIKKVSLDYNFEAEIITPELGKKSRKLRDLEKKVEEESQKI